MADPSPNPNNLVSSPSLSNPNPSSPAFDYATLQQQQQQALLSPSPGFTRTGSLPRISQMQQQFGAAAAAGAMRMYGSGQMSFSTPQQTGRGGQLPMLPGQFNIQPQMLAQQQRGKMGLVQGGLHSGSSSGQGLQGMQSLGMIGGMGMNTQIRANANGNLVYNQQRIGGQLRQQPSSSQQTQLTSPQKLQGQTIPRQLSLSAMNPQLSGLTQNGQSALVQSTLSQQQWLKQIKPTMSTAVSPSYHVQQQRQQQAFMQQQLSSSQMLPQSMGLNHQQISQLIQQQPQLVTQLHQQQRKHLSLQQQQLQPLSMQQQQQLSPRMAGPALHSSINLIGSQPGTPVSGGTTGGSATQGIGASNQLLGKRKIQDLVAQVDPQYKLEPEVEDLLLEMADHFIDSVTSFACSIAKHRKSSTLESKDVLLNLEKNWHLSIPGYSRDENKYQRNSLGRTLSIQQSERDPTTVKATARQASSDSSVDRSIKPSPSSEHLGIPSNASQMMQKITRF